MAEIVPLVGTPNIVSIFAMLPNRFPCAFVAFIASALFL